MANEWEPLYLLGRQLSPTGAGDTQSEQQAWLLDCLRRNQNTVFGLKHRFSQIASIGDYRRQVPLATYADLSPFILRMRAGESDVLFQGRTVAFALTGGTSGKKWIPYSPDSLDAFRTALLGWLAQIIATYQITQGAFYWAVSPALRDDEKAVAGVKVGMTDADYFGNDAARLLAPLSAVPFWVGDIVDFADWQLATLYFLLVHEDLEFISVWSPTFLMALIDAIKNRKDELTSLLSRGAMVADRYLDADQSALIRLNEYLDAGKIYRLWPHLKLVSCWMNAASEPFAVKLKRFFPTTPFQPKGLLATEGIVTVPDKDGRPRLSTQSGFFEFIDDRNHLCLADELASGKGYEVVMTTAGGLYRYRIGDKVLCEGFDRDVPILRFSGRIGLSSDLVGEKLTDDFVTQCLQDIPGSRFLFPDIRNKPRYVLAVAQCDRASGQALLHKVESELSKNPQYAYARKIGQLDRLTLYHDPGLLEKYLRAMTSSGIRLGDVKPPSLRPETHWLTTLKAPI